MADRKQTKLNLGQTRCPKEPRTLEPRLPDVCEICFPIHLFLSLQKITHILKCLREA